MKGLLGKERGRVFWRGEGAWSWVEGGGTHTEGVRLQDLDQKLIEGDWEQELMGRGENQDEGFRRGCHLNKRKVGT
jgi:hypothetical protein